jgi:hypothetical protein
VNVNLHIERLVLDGIAVEPAGRLVLQAAVEAELGRLLAQGGIGSSFAVGGAMASLRAGGFHLSGGETRLGGAEHPRQLGRQIAGAAYRGLVK